MASRWQHHRHESAASPAHVVLPSVAQLIASSSTPSTGSIPACHHPNSSLPPILCSTPHSPPSIALSANAPSPTEQSLWRHTNRASPTGSASSMSERSTHHHHPPAHSQPPQGLTFHGYQPEADAHRPTNARRQDSAICHLIRPGTAKEASSLVRPSEPDVASSHRSPDSSRHSTSPTSPGHVLSHSRAPALPTTSHEHVTTSSTPYPQAAPELSNRTHSPLHSDSPQASSTRQTKYNVRFAANHTPENMPSAQRPRHSPPPPVAVQPTEMAPPQEAPERPATPQAEPVRPPVIDRSQIISIIMGHQNGNSQPEPHVDEGVERCPGCGEAWSRTPANAAVLLGHKQVQTHHDYARNMDNYHENLRQFEKENGEAFDQWKKKHSQCPVAPVAPPQANTPAGHSSKRKSEGLHEDVSRKRPTLNGHAATAPPVQSTTPT